MRELRDRYPIWRWLRRAAIARQNNFTGAERYPGSFRGYKGKDRACWTRRLAKRLLRITVVSWTNIIAGKLAPALQSALCLVTAAFRACMPMGGRICFRVSFLFVLVWSIAGAMSIAFAISDDCDPSLEQPNENPYGYRQRGDRCEGQYIKQVSSTTLLVASFTQAFGDYDHSSNKDLVVEWEALGNKQTRLRAYGLRRKLYYRMDTVRSPEAQTFNWAVGLLATLAIPRQDIGVVGWTHYLLGGVEKEIYLPLQINQTKDKQIKEKNRSGIYTLTLLPGVELSEVYVSLATVGKNGDPEIFLRNGIALGNNYYPPDRPIDIPISGLKAPGFYYVEIGAILKTGGSATVEFWFHHPGK